MKLRDYPFEVVQFSCGKCICKSSVLYLHALVGKASLRTMKQYVPRGKLR